MNILLIIIISGLALLGLGSPDKIKDMGSNLSELIFYSPNQSKSQESLQNTSKDTFNLSNVGEQDDIPAVEVLGNLPITSNSNLPTSVKIKVHEHTESFEHQDHHTMEDIHTANADALAILDRISREYDK